MIGLIFCGAHKRSISNGSADGSDELAVLDKSLDSLSLELLTETRVTGLVAVVLLLVVAILPHA